MHAELDPLPEGGRQGGTRTGESHSKYVKDSNKANISLFSQYILTCAQIRVMQLLLFNRTALMCKTTVSNLPLNAIHV